MAQGRQSGGGFGAFLLGVFAALLTLAGAGWVYLHYGHPPVAAADPAFPMEAKLVHIPLHARIDRELEKPPFNIDEQVYEEGAKIYRTSCASCHGTPGQDSPYGRSMYPYAPQLWRKHANSAVVGVSDDEPGETYWRVKNGIRLTGMPAYRQLYSTAQMWDVSLLLKNADQPLPDPVMKILTDPQPPAQSGLNRP